MLTHHSTLWGSCGGLLAFWRIYKRGSVCIVNPITGENRDISTPSLYGYLCGFFFDRFQGRYKLLYVDVSKSNVNNYVYTYYMFDLSESVWRKLDMTKSCLDSRPCRGYPGVIVGDALHWIAHSSYPYPCSKMVVVFKIETQELYSLPHPPVARGGNNNGGNLISATTTCDFPTHESYMQLTAKDGQLCFCHTIVEERVVDLWILEDYENWGSWVKKFKVNLVSIHKIFRRSDIIFFYIDLRIGSPQNGSNEILVTWSYLSWKGLYGYHLETHRSRQLETTGSKGIMHYYVVLPYTKTMLSPMF
ncbi:hypothetical protein LIER_17765 [Lithospermum erythrorhizon]|uniref:F-box associated beta-propeller type 3 domain-containing protein n=1 Tax=Lithospermum erythrorhizon TaxID=34254 RepID=A0AAV3QCL6_LITER